MDWDSSVKSCAGSLQRPVTEATAKHLEVVSRGLHVLRYSYCGFAGFGS